ncbi:MAG: class A beta-lactamase [Parvibaculum sp.]|uniref:class A beta-lactamase n=1 Tax=Parvibaculum sp. TaxID=2024848 RepID=UPI0025F7AFD5|nr:class A beta-lactamase [Parvibaculum sp.]MCE9648961.1 class A beta-lactamase [Parvibaculum sp.]
MKLEIFRREFLLGTAALLAAGPAFADAAAKLDEKLAALESWPGSRLGVSVLDTRSGQRFSHRGGERFGLCSTFKFLAAAAILHRVDLGRDTLDRRVSIGKADIIDYAPVTEKHVGGDMTLGELCAAAVELSDNTAGNLMLAAIGGPAGLTDYARGLGDSITRLDRTEPTLNLIEPGDPRDTTTPDAMLGLMNAILIGKALAPSSRRQITDWLLASKTGGQRIAAGLPSGWKIGDKTGTGAKTETNDVAIVWPPKRPPILVAAYYVGGGEPPEARNEVLANVGRAIASSFRS